MGTTWPAGEPAAFQCGAGIAFSLLSHRNSLSPGVFVGLARVCCKGLFAWMDYNLFKGKEVASISMRISYIETLPAI